MTEEEAHKINGLYKQIDLLTAENTVLKESSAAPQLSLIVERLDTIDVTLKSLADVKKPK
jgi:hypothetical protein